MDGPRNLDKIVIFYSDFLNSIPDGKYVRREFLTQPAALEAAGNAGRRRKKKRYLPRSTRRHGGKKEKKEFLTG